MALSPASASTAFASKHATTDKKSQALVVSAFVDTYDEHAKTAVGTTISITGAGKSALSTALMNLGASGSANVIVLADAIAEYWAAETTPKGPYSILVSSTALSKKSAFASAITSSITVNVSNASIENFFTSTDAVVKTILYGCKITSVSGVTTAPVA